MVSGKKPDQVKCWISIDSHGYKNPAVSRGFLRVFRQAYKPPFVTLAGWRSSICPVCYQRDRAAHPALFAGRVAPMRLLGLAPGGVYLAASIAARAGGLLHRRFTLALFRAIH